MSQMRNALTAAVLAMLLCLGCGSKGPDRLETFPVKGKVTVDGQEPGSAIQIACHPVNGMDPNHPTFSQTETAPDGSFEIATYQAGDGVPAGDYTLTFSWQEFNLLSRGYSGPDKLKRKYNDPKTSEFKISVKPGVKLEPLIIDLKTK